MAGSVRLTRRIALRWWLPRLAVAPLLGGAIALGVDIARLGGPEAWLIAHRLPAPYFAQGRTYDVAGSAVYLDCRGAGSPTVILDSGLGTGAAGWGAVLDRAAAITRTCTWDRPGIGASASIGVHTGEDTARHLRAALDVAGERPPFVVVGHSLGGVYVRIFGATYRDETAGVALIDPYVPDLLAIEEVAVDPTLRAEWLAGLAATNDQIARTEELDWPATERQLRASDLDDLPLELVFVEQHLRWDERYDPWEAELIAVWRAQVTGLSTRSRLTIAHNSTHMIQWDRPDVVVDAIRRLVAAARDG